MWYVQVSTPLKITQHAAVQYGSGVLSWHSGSLLWTRFPEILQSCLMWMLCPYSKILHFHPLTVHTRSTTLRHHGSQGLLCSPTSPIPYSILRLMILLVWWWLCRICKWHWGSCKTCNFTWMLLGTVAWPLSSLSINVTINCFCKNRLPNIKYGSVIKVNNFVCYHQWYKIFLLIPSLVMVDGGETKQFSELHCGRVWRSVGHAGGTPLRYYQGNDSIEVIKLNVSFILLFIFWMPLSMSLC